MALLSKADILSRDDLSQELVAVPEWGGEVLVRTLTGRERDAFEAGCAGDGKRLNLVNVRARLVALCCIDEQGKRLFTDAEAEQLGGKSAAALDRLFAVAQRLNGLGPKDIEALTKN